MADVQDYDKSKIQSEEIQVSKLIYFTALFILWSLKEDPWYDKLIIGTKSKIKIKINLSLKLPLSPLVVIINSYDEVYDDILHVFNSSKNVAHSVKKPTVFLSSIMSINIYKLL